jgi:hypothetical protein
VPGRPLLHFFRRYQFIMICEAKSLMKVSFQRHPSFSAIA